MRMVLLAAAGMLCAAPAFAQSQQPGPDSAYQRHQSTEHFANAGESAGQTARETGKALDHGWQATKQAVRSGWNHVTNDNGNAGASKD